MRQTLKRLAKLTAGYSLVTLLGPLFTIFLTPLYTRVLVPADYGVVDVALTFSGLLTVVVLVGMDQALSAHFFDDGDEQRRNLVTTAIVCVAAGGIALGVIMALFAVPLAVFLFHDPARQFIFYLLAVNLVSAPIYAVVGSALRLRMGWRRVNALGLFALLVTVTTNVIFVLVLHLKATGIVAAVVGANFLTVLFGLVLIWQPLRGTFSFPLARMLAFTGVSLFPGALGQILLANVDRLLLTQFVTQNDIGLYSIANKLASMLYVLLSAAWNAWWAIALEMASQPDATRQFARMFEYFAAGSMCLALAVGLFAPEILLVFARDVYVPAAPYALTLMMYQGPIGFLTGCFTLSLYVGKQTKFVSFGLLIAAAVNIGLNLVLDPIIGVWGAVGATVFAGFILLILTYIFGQRALHVDYRWARVSLLAGVYLGLVAAFLLVPGLNAFIYKIGALMLLGVTVLAVGIISPLQLQMGVQAVRGRVRRSLRLV